MISNLTEIKNTAENGFVLICIYEKNKIFLRHLDVALYLMVMYHYQANEPERVVDDHVLLLFCAKTLLTESVI